MLLTKLLFKELQTGDGNIVTTQDQLTDMLELACPR